MVFSPIEQHGNSDQNPAEAELKVAQQIDRKDDGKSLSELNPHLDEICQRGLRLLIQLIWRQRWSSGGAHAVSGCRQGSVGAHAGTLHLLTCPVTVLPPIQRKRRFFMGQTSNSGATDLQQSQIIAMVWWRSSFLLDRGVLLKLRLHLYLTIK